EVDQAVSDLQALAGRLTGTDYNRRQERLRVALENAGQRILLRYLKGEAVPQTREMFELGDALFAAAHRLAPGDNYLLSRELFCEGRVQVFQMNYDGPGGAIDLLEDAIRLDGSASYAYNAIGIALLQQAEYDRAEAAFRDAIRLAPYWIYPRHNLALALEERGDARAAVEVYRAALDLRPQYAYLAYNLGTTLEKLNRSKTAREAFNQALVLDPAMARAYTGIGVSYALEGSRNKAETAYGQALRILERMPLGEDLLTARHDLALLLSAGEPDRALDLWKDNLAQAPAHLPSLIGMAETYERLGRPEAIEIYERITALQNGYVAAHLAAARLLIAAGRFAEALPHLEQARSLAPENAAAWELSGDAAHGSAEARLYYETALRLARDRAQRARILKKRPQTSPR
ncbi:MAG: tetratricopeptide repeat protein, partial [Acidobacteriia bacterium]|nr:tetratricopeptide repeat protein [Terriglobia bacterium]